LPEIKKLQGEKTVDLVNQFLAKWPNIEGRKQVGEETYYPKRTRRDDEIDLRKTIIENFNHLRIVDNQKYPAWFKFNDQTYILKIYKYQGNIN
jgi:methionyl-tRNA formyltransferase